MNIGNVFVSHKMTLKVVSLRDRATPDQCSDTATTVSYLTDDPGRRPDSIWSSTPAEH